MASLKILAGAVPPPTEKEFTVRPKGGKSNFTKKKPGLGFYGKK
jgi:hypothetical protein